MQLKHFKKTCITITLILLSIVGLAFYIPIYGQQASKKTLSHFYQRAPDAITVFTGDKGRIQSAFELAKKMPGAKLLITGVHNNNSLKTIANHQIDSLSAEKLVENYSHLVEIDYDAKNTIENVITTLFYSRQNIATKKMIIVSSDYHIARIQLILTFLRDSKDEVKYYFFAVPTTPNQPANIKRYFKEIFRLIKSTVLLTLWD